MWIYANRSQQAARYFLAIALSVAVAAPLLQAFLSGERFLLGFRLACLPGDSETLNSCSTSHVPIFCLSTSALQAVGEAPDRCVRGDCALVPAPRGRTATGLQEDPCGSGPVGCDIHTAATEDSGSHRPFGGRLCTFCSHRFPSVYLRGSKSWISDASHQRGASSDCSSYGLAVGFGKEVIANTYRGTGLRPRRWEPLSHSRVSTTRSRRSS